MKLNIHPPLGFLKRPSEKCFDFFILASLLVAFNSLFSCYGAVEENANKILEKSGEMMANMDTFVAEMIDENASNPTKTAMFWSRKPDGFVEMRLERVRLKTGRTNVHIFSRGGKWLIWGGEALKYDAVGAVDSRFKDIGPVLLTGAGSTSSEVSSSLSETNYQGTPCYLIRQIFLNRGDTAKSLDEAIKGSTEASGLFQQLGIRADSLVPKAVDYVIGKTNLFLYSRIIYGNGDKRLSSVSYRNAKVNVPLSEDLFEIPSTLKTREFSSQEEMTKYMADMVQRSKSGGYRPPPKSGRGKYVLAFMLFAGVASFVLIFMGTRRHETRDKT